MKTLKATDFKAACLGVLDDVARTGETVIITKRGRAVAQLVPVRPANLRFPQDGLRGTVQFLGDIMSPAVSPDVWEAEGARPTKRTASKK